jgi:hypothetical protein
MLILEMLIHSSIRRDFLLANYYSISALLSIRMYAVNVWEKVVPFSHYDHHSF